MSLEEAISILNNYDCCMSPQTNCAGIECVDCPHFVTEYARIEAEKVVKSQKN